MESMMSKLLQSFLLGAMSASVVAPMALAVEFRVMTLQERADEIVVEVEDVIENFQALERSLSTSQPEADTTGNAVQGSQEN